MPAPIIIFVYNRPEHTQKMVQALAANDLANESEVFIFADGAKNEKDMERIQAVREYIDSLPDQGLFKAVYIEKADSNKGLAESVISGVSKIIEAYGNAIVVEDDLISAQDFLRFMNQALNYYESNKQIWSISGYSIPIAIPKDYQSDVYLSYRGCSWGWATWKDRWEIVDWEVTDYREFRYNKRARRILNRGGRDMAFMLDAQLEGRIDSWAIRWCYSQSKLNMLTVYPVESRIRNTGLDGSGTHSRVTSRYEVVLPEDVKQFKLDNPGLNPEILRNFRGYYLSWWDYNITKAKKIIRATFNRIRINQKTTCRWR